MAVIAPDPQGATMKLTRRERERERHREEILSAARELFAHQGYDGTSMAQIAERAEFAVGTLYKFFENKQTLYQALVGEAAGEFTRQLHAALTEPNEVLAKLDRYIDTLADLFVEHSALARVYFAQTAMAGLSPTAGLDVEMQSAFDRLGEVLLDVFKSGMRDGQLRQTDPEILAIALEGICTGFLHALIANPEAFPAERIATNIKTVFFEAIRLPTPTSS